MSTPGIDVPCMDCGAFYGDDCPRCGVDARRDLALTPVFPTATVEEERRRIEDEAAAERDQWKWAA